MQACAFLTKPRDHGRRADHLPLIILLLGDRPQIVCPLPSDVPHPWRNGVTNNCPPTAGRAVLVQQLSLVPEPVVVEHLDKLDGHEVGLSVSSTLATG